MRISYKLIALLEGPIFVPNFAMLRQDGGQVRFDAQHRNELTHPTFIIKIKSGTIFFRRLQMTN